MILVGLLVAFACAPKPTEPVATPVAELPDGRALFVRHLEAIGGEAAVRAHKTTRVEGSFSMPAQGISGPLEVLSAAPDLYYSSFTIRNLGKVEEGHYEGKLGWRLDPMSGAALAYDDEALDLSLRSRYYGDAEFDEIFTSFRTVGPVVPWAGEPCWQVEAVLTTGRPQTHYFSEASGLRVGLVYLVPTAMGDVAANLELYDYAPVEGDLSQLLTSRRMLDRKGPIEAILEMKKITFDDPAFALPPLPPDVQALVAAEAPAQTAP